MKRASVMDRLPLVTNPLRKKSLSVTKTSFWSLTRCPMSLL